MKCKKSKERTKEKYFLCRAEYAAPKGPLCIRGSCLRGFRRVFCVVDDTVVKAGTLFGNLQVRYSIFFCFSKRKRWLVRNGLDRTSPRYSRSLLSSESVSSSSNCKRSAGLQFEARGDFDFPPEPPLKRPEKPLRFFWTFPAKFGTAQKFVRTKTPSPPEKVARRAE